MQNKNSEKKIMKNTTTAWFSQYVLQADDKLTKPNTYILEVREDGRANFLHSSLNKNATYKTVALAISIHRFKSLGDKPMKD